ncbi:MAG: transketolase [Candidatus Levybacteria bacterium]|nr:transketolase [Candidatus Levybacteria bacterium]
MEDLEKLARLVRYYCLLSTAAAGSGHLTSSLSAADLMTVLFFGGFFRFDPINPDFPNNDRVIFSKGHASSLLYSLWTVGEQISEDELVTYRKFGSPLEGHPSMEFKFSEAATGSLGQGLSIGLGMALAAKMDGFSYKNYVLLGDGEMAEGQIWEAVEIASFYKLNNLIGIVDVNRLGQSGETMIGWNVKEYQKRLGAFGWETILIDGHNIAQISEAYAIAEESKDKPVMIIAKTVKGKGLAKLENKEGFHGKALPRESIGEAKSALGKIDRSLRGQIAKPRSLNVEDQPHSRYSTHVAQRRLYYVHKNVAQSSDKELIATRYAYGQSLISLLPSFPSLVVLDGEVSNSTYSDKFKEKYPDKFFEMFIAEQNMVSCAVGLSKRGKMPFVSTFSAFFTRAHDQIRMAAYSNANIKFCGSHSGVSIGEDGASQMGLEDIAMFRSLQGSVVLYPSDAISTQKLVEEAAKHSGLVYIRTTRKETPVIYHEKEEFEIGGSKIIKISNKDKASVIGAGITLHEALKAYEQLKKEGIEIRLIDLYSVKPIDCATLKRAAEETSLIIVVEDHRPEGGIAEAVRSCLSDSKTPVYSLSVSKMPKSGKPEELLNFEQIDSKAIAEKVKEILS